MRLLKHLWERSEGSAAEIHGAVGAARRLAFTTTATMLRKMEERGLVSHRTEGRAVIYRAVVTEEEVSKSMAHDLLDRLFEGSVANMVSHLLSTREVSAEELKELEKLVRKKKERK